MIDPLPQAIPARPSFGLGVEEMGRLTEIVAQLSKSQLPLPEVLMGMAEDIPSKELSKALKFVGKAVSEGLSVEEALDQAQAHSSTSASGIVRTILRTGTPSQTLFRILKYQQERAQLRRTFWLKLSYPILLIFFCSILFGGVMWVVSNQMVPIFRDFGVSLPGISQAVISLADLTARIGLAGVFIPPVIACCTLWVVSCGINGSLHKWLDLAQFCRTMSDLVEASCPLLDSLTICRMMLTGKLALATEDMIDLVRHGDDLATALELQKSIPDGVSQLVRWSQASGGTGAEGLKVSAALFEARSRSQTRFLSSLFSVVAVLFVSWLILLITLAIFLPLITMISRLSG